MREMQNDVSKYHSLRPGRPAAMLLSHTYLRRVQRDAREFE